MIDRMRDIPVIFITALDDVHDKVAAFPSAGVDYVTKPFHVEELLARITTHLTLRVAQKQLAMQNGQLHTSEIRYRKLFETAKDGILLLNLESGKVTDVNLSMVNLLGYSREHYLNFSFWDILPFRYVPGCRECLAELQTKESASFDHWLLEAQDKSRV